ncbi:hypothetical protein ABW19_dt0209250 [Dactylella cylindrospora]|nr:hypothetical protein ABW19_dt0209250 [Dactylella cylindrospora]
MGASSKIASDMLTPSRRESTNVPFPSKGNDTTGSVVVDICSEFTEYHAAVEYFKSSEKLRLVHDALKRPIIFTVSEKQLCVLRHGVSSSEGWSSLDITPAGCIATTFDVLQVGGTLFIAVACKKTDAGTESEFHELFHCTLDISAESFSFQAKAKITEQNQKGLDWVIAADNSQDHVGDLVISSILCRSKSPSRTKGDSPEFEVIVGTQAHGSKIGTHYLVDPTTHQNFRWIAMTFPAAASTLVQTEPLVLGTVESGFTEDGLVSLFKDFSSGEEGRCVGQVAAEGGGYSRSFEYKAGELGDLRAVYSVLNPWGLTDVIIAGKGGLGYFSFENVDNMVGKPILPNISFRQLVASEDVDPAKPDEQSKIAIFAVSDENHLYYIEGTRSFSDRSLNFQASGLPIRTDITHLSARYNSSYGTSELLYAGREQNALYFIRREPISGSWAEQRITRKAKTHVRFDAFVSTMVFSDGKGNPLPVDQPVEIMAEFVNVVINGKSCSLTNTPTIVYPDENGCVMVAMPAQNRLGHPPLTVRFGSQPYTFKVEPSERVIRLLQKYDSTDKLQNATSPKGEKAFSGSDKEKVEQAATIVSQFGKMKGALENPQTAPKDTSEEPSWLQNFGDTVLSFFGDVIECLKKVVKTGVKIFIKVFGPVIKFAFNIMGKVFVFAVKAIFGVLEDAFIGMANTTARFLEKNRSSVQDLFNDSAFQLSQFVDDPRVPNIQNEQNREPSWMDAIFNNPLVKLVSKINPIEWVMEAASEEVPDMKLPDFGTMLSEMAAVLTDTVTTESEILTRLIKTFIEQVQNAIKNFDPMEILNCVLNSLKAIIWTVFETMENFALKFWDALIVFVRGISSILSSPWKIPGITDVWEEITGSEFSIFGFMSFVPSAILNLVFLTKDGNLPFQNVSLPNWDSIEIPQAYKARYPDIRKARGQQGQQSTSKVNQVETLNPQPHMMSAFAIQTDAPNLLPIQTFSARKIATTSGLENPEFSLKTMEVMNIPPVPTFEKPKPIPGNKDEKGEKKESSLSVFALICVCFELLGQTLTAVTATIEAWRNRGGAVQIAPEDPGNGPDDGGGNNNQVATQPNAHKVISFFSRAGQGVQGIALVAGNVFGGLIDKRNPFSAIPAGLGVFEMLCLANTTHGKNSIDLTEILGEVFANLGTLTRVLVDNDYHSGSNISSLISSVTGLTAMLLNRSQHPYARAAAIGLRAASSLSAIIALVFTIIHLAHGGN